MSFGLDYVSGPPIAAMKDAGVTFVCRYLSYVNALTQVKLLQPAEAKTLGENGIAIVSNYEWYADRALEGAASGVQDAQIAAAQHLTCGGPDDRPIYFSVDTDVSGSQVLDYFKGVASVIGLSRTGAYGSFRVLKELFDANAIAWGWQTYAWSGGAWEPRAHIQQYQNGVDMSGHSVDYDRALKSDFGQWFSQTQGGSTPMPTTTPGGENAVFIDNIDQLEPGETEDACVAFSAANIFYSTQPGTQNHYTTEQVDQLADKWYVKETGSITSSAGLSVQQLQDMLDGMGLHWETIPITSNGPANDEAVRSALRAGKLVIVCASESSFFDLEIGRPPYSWNTQPFNHCIVVTGNITSGPWAGNVWVRDTVAVSGGYPPSTKRPYDLAKMQYVSLTAVTPTWLKGETPMIPTGWHDANNTLTAPNGVPVVLGFRAYILSAESWDPGNMPQEAEYHTDQVLLHNAAIGAGQRQCFRDGILWYTPAKGVVWEPLLGMELDAAYQRITALQAQIPPANQPVPSQPPANVAQAISDVEGLARTLPPMLAKILADLGSTPSVL